MHKKITELSCKRIQTFIESEIPWYKGHETYIQGLTEEIQEMKQEIKDNNSVYLEDELGDVFWDYICLLHSLHHEGKITSVEKVFERCYEKFSGRISPKTGQNNGKWEETKQQQKQKLKEEHNTLYGNS